ncbi:ABC transporter substrate-binding protein [Rubrobacter indicoceani]|uniref:ABC transporter substrate-binding protein n=1 Tax=Rubrobacter indicoceani TaxID=2051957 RepID=UPI000E5B3006|nr:iron-siderophore ABC transporter substrate-binding protein [Rubrobacter indicoceani]
MSKRFFRKAGLALLGATTLSLAACGGNPDSGSGGGSGEETGSGSSGGTRTLEHAMGTAEVPENPERVVVLDTGELDSAVSLGVTPVGAVEAVAGQGLPGYLEGTDEIELVGTIEEPNLETISTLEPDLILSSSLRHEAIYDQLSQIAPTVFTEETGVTWRENFDKHAEALNREAEAEQVVSDYESRIEDFRNATGDTPPTVSVVRFTPGDTRIYQKESFIGTILDDAGLPRPEAQDVEDFALLNVTAEAIPDMAGDVIYTTVYDREADTAKADITSDPLWQNLEAVQNDRVYEVSDDLWMLGIGYTAAQGVLSDLEETITDGSGSTTMETTMMETTG